MNKSYNNFSQGKVKTFQELNLIDSFLFGASTEKPQNAEFIAKLIIERVTGKKVGKISVIPEKTLSGVDVGNRGIRMDLYIEEYENEQMVRVYDIEPNKYRTAEIPMRSRYSQALTDVKLLNSGEAYHKLPDYVSIWILPYDIFGENRMLYTVKNCVVENRQIVYNDGVMKLFLYADGEIGDNEELKNLLQYFSKSNEENVVDSELSRLHHIVETVRHNREVGEQYMTLKEYMEFEKAEACAEACEEARIRGHAEGLAQARTEGIRILVSMLQEMNISDEEITEKLVEKYNISVSEAKAYLK